MSGECDKCGKHALECGCVVESIEIDVGSLNINNAYRGKCDICEQNLGEALAIYAGTSNPLRHLKEKQQAHLDCYIDRCVEIKVNELLRHRPVP